MSSYYYQSRKKKTKTGMQKGVTGVLCFAVAVVLLLSILVPAATGQFGQIVHDIFVQFAGWASVTIPLYLGWLGFLQFVKDKETHAVRTTFLYSVFLTSSAAFLSLLPHAASTNLGGFLGDKVSLFFVQQFGKFLTYLLSSVLIFLSGSWLSGTSPWAVLTALRQKIQQDLKDWQEERRLMAQHADLKKKIEKRSSPLGSSKSEKDEDPEIELPQVSAPPAIHRPSITEPKKVFQLQKNKLAEAAKDKNNASVSANANDPTTPAVQNYDGYRLPDPDLLTYSEQTQKIDKDELYGNGTLLEKTLDQFGVKAKVIDIHPGPVITRYDLSPAPGVRVTQIETLSSDIALAMKAHSVRVLAPVPGKAAVGIEIPNPKAEMVYLKEIILSPKFQNSTQTIPLGIGKTTEGDGFVSDLTTMPHLLIAGSTGSGKSVCIHSLVLSILFRFRPDEVKIMMIDPKRLELPVYDSIPHIYDPSSHPQDAHVITQPKETVIALKKLVEVMEDRYRSFAKYGVRNIESYNKKAETEGFPKAYYLVVIVDELADLMIVVGKEIEDLIQRLAQMARAVGIHLVLATQRPSVDVITGVIKANLPSRIAFQVLSKTDSRVILDAVGAEDLLGKGDMLFLYTGAARAARLQGAFVSENEVNRVVQFIKEQNFKPQYEPMLAASANDSMIEGEENQRLLLRAARVVRESEKVSGDLLRADKEIGSKYDLALILLKKKGLIEKPKDTNRWHIHFDRLAEFIHEKEKQNENN